MLAYFHRVKFSVQELNFFKPHVFFRHDLDCYFLASFLVNSCMYRPRDSFSQCLIDIVIVENVSISGGLLDNFHPFFFLRLAREVILSHLILGKDELERVELPIIETFFFCIS